MTFSKEIYRAPQKDGIFFFMGHLIEVDLNVCICVFLTRNYANKAYNILLECKSYKKQHLLRKTHK